MRNQRSELLCGGYGKSVFAGTVIQSGATRGHADVGIVKTCGLACHDEVVRSVVGRERSCRSDQEPSLTIRLVVGTPPVTNADGTALGCVVPRRPCALGYWPAAAR